VYPADSQDVIRAPVTEAGLAWGYPWWMAWNLIRPALLVAAALLCGGCWGKSNYAQCVVKEISRGVESDGVARSIVQSCLNKHGFATAQEALASVPPGGGRGMFSFKSGAECAAKRGRKVRSELGARALRAACNRLYEPVIYDPFDPARS